MMNYDTHITAIAAAHGQALAGAAGAVHRHLILRNGLIGAHLVEFEQAGDEWTKYGAWMLKRVAGDLKGREIPGCAIRMLERIRIFYLTCPQVQEAISSPPVTFSNKKLPSSGRQISSPRVTKSPAHWKTASSLLPISILLRLSWTHLP